MSRPNFLQLPDVYPNETVHSLCSRHLHYHKLPGSPRIIELLFGSERIGSFVDVPHHLDGLLSNIRIHDNHTIEKLIRNHTLLPFYTFFWDSERIAQLLWSMGLPNAPKPEEEAMVGNRGLSVSHGTEGRVRYCPDCATEQQQKYGEAYWMRLHQALGVEVCPVHGVFLVKTKIRFASGYPRELTELHRPLNTEGQFDFGIESQVTDESNFSENEDTTEDTEGNEDEEDETESAEDSVFRNFYYPNQHIESRMMDVDTSGRTPIDPNNRAHQLLVEYANDVQWLLGQGAWFGRREGLVKRLVLALSRAGYGGYGLPDSRAHGDMQRLVDQLRSDMIAHYSHDVLQELNVSFKREDSDDLGVNWVQTVIPDSLPPIINPMQLWLMIRFLGHDTLEAFWDLPDGGCEWHRPYPCLSVDCPNYWVNGTYNDPCKYAPVSVDE